MKKLVSQERFSSVLYLEFIFWALYPSPTLKQVSKGASSSEVALPGFCSSSGECK